MSRLRLAFLLLGLLCVVRAHAGSTFTVTVDTTPLVGIGPFTLDIQFIDGTGLPGDLNNNTITLGNFSFGGGSAVGGGTAVGGASGSLPAGITLHDTSFFNEYLQDFQPGTLLKFDVSVTNVFNPSGIPDLFTVAILDSSGIELPTTGFANEFVAISLEGGAAPVVTAAGSTPGSQFQIAVPSVQGSQSITFTSSAPSAATVGGATYNVTATGGASGNPVTFSIDATASSRVFNCGIDRVVHRHWNVCDRCQPGGQRQLRDRSASPTIFHGFRGNNQDQSVDHLQQADEQDYAAIAGDGERDRVVGAAGDLHDHYPGSLHARWDERGDDHAGCQGDLHGAGQSSRQRRLCGRHSRESQLHGVASESDDHLHCADEEDLAGVTGDGGGDGIVRVDGHVYDDDATGMYGGWRERIDDHAGGCRDLHGESRPGRRCHL